MTLMDIVNEMVKNNADRDEAYLEMLTTLCDKIDILQDQTQKLMALYKLNESETP